MPSTPRAGAKSRTVGGATTVYVTDADNREVLEYDGTTGAVQAWYAYGQGSNEPLNRMDVSAGSRQTLVPDAQGSIVSRSIPRAARSRRPATVPMARTHRRRRPAPATPPSATIRRPSPAPPKPAGSTTTAPGCTRRPWDGSSRSIRQVQAEAARTSMPMSGMIR
ncbi:MAG: hypothetical protein WDM81_14155 [Rhizomicrobium sp.]